MQLADSKLNKRVSEPLQQEKALAIGALLLDEGIISLKDIERIIALQKQKGIRFGDAGKMLNLINDDDIQKALSYQFDFPFLTEDDHNLSKSLFAAYQPFSPQVEALRAVRGELMLRWFSNSQKTLALVSPDRSEGRSHMAANLAIVFAQLGERTLLIDADLRQPQQHVLFKLNNRYGLSDILNGRADLSIIEQIPVFRKLAVLTAGTKPPNPVELITRGLNNCLQQLQTQFDVILFDTSSAKQGIEAQIITSGCGGALLVTRQHKTRLNDLQLLRDTLQFSGSQCLGALLTSF